MPGEPEEEAAGAKARDAAGIRIVGHSAHVDEHELDNARRSEPENGEPALWVCVAAVCTAQ